MHFYINEIKDTELIKRLKEEAKKRKRSLAFVVREKLLKTYGLGNGGD